MSSLLSHQISLINWTASNLPHLRLVQHAAPGVNGAGVGRGNPYGAYNGVAGGGWGDWWWLWVAIAIIIILLIASSWSGYPSSWRGRTRKITTMTGPTSVGGVGPAGIAPGDPIGPAGANRYADRGYAWVVIALVIIVGIFIAGVWWWGAGTRNNYAGANRINHNGYVAGTNENAANRANDIGANAANR